MDSAVITTIVAAILSSGVVGVIATAFFNRKKVSADTTKVITDIAVGLADKLDDRMGKLENKLTETENKLAEAIKRAETAEAKVVAAEAQYTEDMNAAKRRIARLERRERAARTVLQIHGAWDMMAVLKLRESGIDLGDVPPLTSGMGLANESIEVEDDDDEAWGGIWDQEREGS